MPECERCNKITFDGTRWKSATNSPQYKGKYLCLSCSKELSGELHYKNLNANETCAKCGKELKGFFEKLSVVGIVANKYPIYAGRKLCEQCRNELQYSKNINQAELRVKTVVNLNPEVNKAILWQKDEVLVDQKKCTEFFEDHTMTFGGRNGNNGFLVVTNQRILFVCKMGLFSSNQGIIYAINIEDIMSVSQGKFGFTDKLVILDKNGHHKDFIERNIHSMIPNINKAITERRTQLQAQKEKERFHIVLDFSSLKDVMSKGGLVMTTYKCPNCSGILKLPEEGKILMCEYCGTPIKPVDIFEKIKSLIT